MLLTLGPDATRKPHFNDSDSEQCKSRILQPDFSCDDIRKIIHES